ncbi:MAG TPA: hypothetical protein VK506_16645, partial [Conexibacter sp.]|nr:hypothetical protein [Conexibacter sp.]
MANDILGDAQEQLGAQPENPYAETIRSMRTTRTIPLRQSVAAARDKDPERSADVLKLSKRLQLPPALIERNYDELKKRDDLESTPFHQMIDETPALAKWAEQPENLAVAGDDLHNLGALEWLVTAPVRAFTQATNAAQAADLRYESMFRPLTQAETDRLHAADYQAQRGGTLGADRWFQKAITGVGSFLANQVEPFKYALAGAAEVGAAGAAVGSLVPGPGTVAGGLAGAGYGFTAGLLYGVVKSTFRQEAGNAYQEFSNFTDEHGQPMDRDAARMAAIAVGALNAPIEGAGELLVFAKSIPGLDKVVGKATSGMITQSVKAALRVPTVRAALAEAAKSYGTTLVGESLQEAGQRAIAIVAGEVAKAASGQQIKGKTVGEGAAEVGQEFVGAAESFALGMAGGPLLSATTGMRQARQAAQNAQFFEQLGKGAAASKTIARAPAAAQAMLSQATKGGPVEHVYAPVGHWAEYWQSQGVDPAAVAADVTGNPRAYDEAVSSGLDLKIPTASYAVKLAATQHNAALAKELRLGHPDAMNLRESEEFAKAVEAESQQAPAAPAVEPIKQAVVESLAGAGYRAVDAGRVADAYQETFGNLAERAGEDPLATFAQYGLRVERPGLTDTTTAAAVPATEPDAAAAAIAASAPTLGTNARGETIEPLAGEAPFVERRTQQLGAPPEGERRDPNRPIGLQPNFSKHDVVAAAAAMRAENPNIDAEAQAMRDRAQLAGRIKEPGDLAALRAKGIVDNKADDAIASAEAARPPRVEGQRRAEATAAPGAGERSADRPGEQPGADQSRVSETGGDGDRAERGGIPAARPAEYGEVFERQPKDVNAARLTPEVNTALQWILDELENFPFVERTWNFVEGQKTGNAAGGDADIVAGSAGTPVYDDVLYFAPVNKNTKTGEPGKQAFGKRGKVEGAIRRAIRDQDIHNNLAEGAVRVAELRAAGQWKDLSKPWLPKPDAVVAPEAFTDALSDAIDVALGEDVDDSFDITEFDQGLFDNVPPPDVDTLDTGEQQPRLPGDAGAVREQEIKTPELEIPFALTSEVGKGKKGKQTTLFQGGAGQTNTPAFRAWFGDSKVVDEDGDPLVVYHGTTGNFEAFDPARANQEADFGAGFYFSNTTEDVGANYAGIGPDLESKLQRRVEQLESEYDYDEESKKRITEYMDEHGVGLGEATIALAREDLGVEHEGATVPVFLKIENPVILGGDDETQLEMTQPMDEETGDFLDEEPTGTLIDFLDALRNIASRYDDGDVDEAIAKVMEEASYESITARKALEIIRSDEKFSYFTDNDNGNLVGNEIIRQAFERAGFDGVIDRSVDVKFGSQRRIGKAMAGMHEDTVHYIAFRPTQIKSAIGNRGTFDPHDENILYQSAPEHAAFYSRLTRAVEESKQPKASGAQWKAQIKNAKIGVNKDEFAYASVDDLEDGKTYTKQEVLDYLAINTPKVEEVVLDQESAKIPAKELEAATERLYEERYEEYRDQIAEAASGYANDNAPNYDVEELELESDDEGGEPTTVYVITGDDDDQYFEGQTFETKAAAEAAADEHRDSIIQSLEDDYVSNDDGGPSYQEAEDDAREQLEREGAGGTHYEEYTEPGADPDTYAEAFVTLPDPKQSAPPFDPARVHVERKRSSVTQGSVHLWYGGESLATYGDDIKLQPDGTYAGPDDAHWIDVARRLYEKGDRINRIAPTRVGWVDGHDPFDHIENPVVRVRFNIRTIGDHAVMFLEEVQPPQPGEFEKMPELFQKNWREIGFKWALRRAAAVGATHLAWTTGQQQADRYSL